MFFPFHQLNFQAIIGLYRWRVPVFELSSGKINHRESCNLRGLCCSGAVSKALKSVYNHYFKKTLEGLWQPKRANEHYKDETLHSFHNAIFFIAHKELLFNIKHKKFCHCVYKNSS
jgi:hypothetical protein